MTIPTLQAAKERPFPIRKREEDLICLVNSGEWEIDNDGRIWRIRIRNRHNQSFPCQRVRAERITERTGYLVAISKINGRQFVSMSHRLVYLHFNGPIPDSLVINHKNGIKTDNRPENLEAVTIQDNNHHMRTVLKRGAIFLQSSQEKTPVNLTLDQKIEICRALNNGARAVVIAHEYGIHRNTVHKIHKMLRGRIANHQMGGHSL